MRNKKNSLKIRTTSSSELGERSSRLKMQPHFESASLEKDIKEIIAKVARVKKTDIKNDTKLRDELGIDSLNAMEILAAVEVKYGIILDEARAFDIVTMEDLYRFVTSYL